MTVKKEFSKANKNGLIKFQMNRRLPKYQSVEGVRVRFVMRQEMTFEWKEKMDQMRRSVNFLINKHRASRREEVPES